MYDMMSLSYVTNISLYFQYAWDGDGQPEIALEEVLFENLNISCPQLKKIKFQPGESSWYDAAFKGPIMHSLEEYECPLEPFKEEIPPRMLY
jgi:hypothetical protein